MPIQTHQGAGALLAVSPRRQFIALAGGSGASQATANIAHGCFTMEGFNPDKVTKALTDYGVKSYVTMRMEDRGGAKGGTPELYFTDPDGILMQIQDVTYCGGGGYLGEVCNG